MLKKGFINVVIIVKHIKEMKHTIIRRINRHDWMLMRYIKALNKVLQENFKIQNITT